MIKPFLLSFLLIPTLCVANHYNQGMMDARALLDEITPQTAEVSDMLHTNGEIDGDTAANSGGFDEATTKWLETGLRTSNIEEFQTGVGTLNNQDIDCIDGQCDKGHYTKSTDFAPSIAKFLGLLEAGRSHVPFDESGFALLPGSHKRCHEAGFGYNNCCSDKGWGQDMGLAGCNGEEKDLGAQRAKGVCVYAGSYCAKKVARRCVTHKQSWCCYNSKLAKIIQENGHVQLNWSYGNPKAPNCGGFPVAAFERLNFDAMDFSPAFADINARVTPINEAGIRAQLSRLQNDTGGAR